VSGQRCDLTDLLVTQCACKKHRGGAEVTDELKTVGQPFADDPGYVHAGRCPR
jgi:hypothetical protein